MKLSCAGYTFHSYFHEKGLLLHEYLDVCADMGLDGVELTQYYFPETSRPYLNGLKRHMHRRGMVVAGAAIGGAFCQADPEARRKHVAFAKEWLEISCQLGAPVLRVFAGPAPEGHTEEEAAEWAVAGIRECAEKAAEVGVMIGLENHGGITGTAEGLLRLLHGVGSDWVGALLDFGNFSKDPYREFELIAPHAVMTHAKPTSDFAGTRGEVDYRRVKQIMDQAGYHGFLSIEYEEPGKDAMIEVPRFAAYLKGVQEL